MRIAIFFIAYLNLPINPEKTFQLGDERLGQPLGLSAILTAWPNSPG
jgi:hypothetical protein